MISICTTPTSSFGFGSIESGSILSSPLHLVAGKAAEEKVGGSGDVCNGREERREQCWDAFPLGRGGEEEEERETAKRVRKGGPEERERETKERAGSSASGAGISTSWALARPNGTRCWYLQDSSDAGRRESGIGGHTWRRDAHHLPLITDDPVLNPTVPAVHIPIIHKQTTNILTAVKEK